MGTTKSHDRGDGSKAISIINEHTKTLTLTEINKININIKRWKPPKKEEEKLKIMLQKCLQTYPVVSWHL
jgi:hypothetical protein